MKIITTVSKLGRDFLACCPVIAPHSPIEAELLYAGIKPVGCIEYPLEEEPSAILKKLDLAVGEGRLVSIDGMNSPFPGYFPRYYAQPDKLEDMRRLHAFWENPNNQPTKLSIKDTGLILGYRPRDVAFFSAYWNCLETLGGHPWMYRVILGILEPFHLAHRSQMLERAVAARPDILETSPK